jgi:hypothetical protein
MHPTLPPARTDQTYPRAIAYVNRCGRLSRERILVRWRAL